MSPLYGTEVLLHTGLFALPNLDITSSNGLAVHQHGASTIIEIVLTRISDNQETSNRKKSANTPVLANSVLHSNCFIATDNENSTDDSAPVDVTIYSEADLLNLPGYQKLSTLLSHANTPNGWISKAQTSQKYS